MDDLKLELAQKLIQIDVLEFGHFTCNDNKTKSEVHLDMNVISDYPSVMSCMANVIKNELEPILKNSKANEATGMHNVALVGIPSRSWFVLGQVAGQLELACHQIRAQGGAQQRQQQQQQQKQPASDFREAPEPRKTFTDRTHVIVVDLLTTACAVEAAVESLGPKNVTDIVIVVDCELGGQEKLERLYSGIKTHTILKVSDLLNISQKV